MSIHNLVAQYHELSQIIQKRSQETRLIRKDLKELEKKLIEKMKSSNLDEFENSQGQRVSLKGKINIPKK